MPEPHRVDGVLLKHQKDKPTFGQTIKLMAKIEGKDVLPNVEIHKHHPYQPRPNARKPHKRSEKLLEISLIKKLRENGCYCGKVEPHAGGRRSWNKGIADIMCFSPAGRFYFIEVKIGNNDLSAEQEYFRIHCMGCGVNYITARKIEDVEGVYR